MTDDELREMLALEAVGALSDTERAELDAAIEARPDLRAELDSYRGAAAMMAEAVREEPPPGLRARVLETIAETPQEPALPTPEAPAAGPAGPDVAPVVPISAGRHRRHEWLRWGGIAAAAAAVAVAVVVVSPFGSDDAGDHLAEVLDAPDRQVIELTGELTGLRLVFSDAVGATVLDGEGVEPPEGDDVYELWRIAGAAAPEPMIREFRPEDDGSVAELMEGLNPGDDVFAVTQEPDGGSDEPTSDPIATTT
jgi:negative regulator of sigma E activity